MALLLTRILWLRRSKWQFLMAGFAFVLGLGTMLIALEAWLKVNEGLAAQKAKGQYLILNKKVSLVNTLGLATTTFDDREIAFVKRQPIFKQVGKVQSNQFQASIRATAYIRFYTMAFFESVSPGFLDANPEEFRWQPGQKELPIIVSQDFLNLYNFGFALSQGLPQVSREALKMVDFDVEINGSGGKEVFQGKIVGFSERIASVLVPMTFMEWGNQTIAGKKDTEASRLVVRVESTGDPKLAQFLKNNRLTTDQERMQMGKTGSVLTTVMQSLTLVGGIFMTLSLIMFAMNFRLILAEAAQDIRLLIELGYRHTRIGWNLLFYFVLFILILFGLSSLIVVEAHSWLMQTLEGQGLDIAQSTWPTTTLLAGLAFSMVIILLNGGLILKQLRQIA
jgi:hypothetical protein